MDDIAAACPWISDGNRSDCAGIVPVLYFDDEGIVRGDAIVLREVGEENDRTPSLHMQARIKERENTCLKTMVTGLSSGVVMGEISRLIREKPRTLCRNCSCWILFVIVKQTNKQTGNRCKQSFEFLLRESSRW